MMMEEEEVAKLAEKASGVGLPFVAERCSPLASYSLRTVEFHQDLA